MGLDGDTGGKSLPAENWREKSVRVGVLSYWGDGGGIDFAVTDPILGALNQQDKNYERAGVFVSWYFQDLNVFGVYLHGHDSLRNFDPVTGDQVSQAAVGYDSWFAQADYVILPPFQVSLRYESLNPGDPAAVSSDFWNANFSFLSRANVKMMAEYRWDTHESQDYTMAGILRFAY
jgi:hypothetical protein